MRTITKEDVLDYRTAISELMDIEDRYVIVKFDDGDKKLLKRYTIIYLNIWWIALKWEVPFVSKYIFDTKEVTNKTIGELNKKIYDDIVKMTNETGAQYDFWKSQNNVRKFVLNNCGKYQRGLSRIKIARMMKDPKVKDITDSINFKNKSINEVEEILDKKGEELVNLLKTDKVQHNELRPYLKLGLLNTKQIKQVLLAVGTRADLNDEIITHPIERPFYKGLYGIKDAIVEFITAKKSSFYNKAAVGDASAYSKSAHLVTESFKYVYDKPCAEVGMYLPYHVLPGTSVNFVGKYIWKNNTEVLVTPENHKELDGRLIHMRSIMGCKHRDGVCVRCGGTSMDYKPNQIKVGLSSIVALTKPTIQSVLSAKHHQDTTTLTYKVPSQLKDLFDVYHTQIYVNPVAAKKLEKCKIVLPLEDIPHIPDLHEVNDLGCINEDYFSHINVMGVADENDNLLSKRPINMKVNQMTPYFTRAMLEHIKANYEQIEITEKTIAIPLVGYNFRKAMMAVPVTDDSQLAFVNRIKSFSGAKLAKKTDLPKTFKELTEMLYEKVNLNIVHIEMMLRANLVTNPYDYQTPIITQDDLDKPVYFDSNKRVINNRGWGTALVNRNVYYTITDPTSYLIPRKETDYDIFAGIK